MAEKIEIGNVIKGSGKADPGGETATFLVQLSDHPSKAWEDAFRGALGGRAVTEFTPHGREGEQVLRIRCGSPKQAPELLEAVRDAAAKVNAEFAEKARELLEKMRRDQVSGTALENHLNAELDKL